jgi:hypothetical protein
MPQFEEWRQLPSRSVQDIRRSPVTADLERTKAIPCITRPMSNIALGGLSLDCDDPAALARFWADLLGGEIVLSFEEVVVVKLKHVLVTATRVENYVPPTWPMASVPKQAHIDVRVDDLPGAEVRAISLGAVRAHLQPDPESYLIFLDPAGHPFCLTTQIPKEWCS